MNHSNSLTADFHANFLVVTAGNDSARLYRCCMPNTEIVPVPVLSDRVVPWVNTWSSASKYCFMPVLYYTERKMSMFLYVVQVHLRSVLASAL